MAMPTAEPTADVAPASEPLPSHPPAAPGASTAPASAALTSPLATAPAAPPAEQPPALVSAPPSDHPPLVRLAALSVDKVPGHAALGTAESGGSGEEARVFAARVLVEGVKFAEGVQGGEFKARGWKSGVEILVRKIVHGRIAEDWVARRSLHVQGRENERAADFAEFEVGLLRDHSLHEAEYTPNVFDAGRVCDWDVELQGKAVTSLDSALNRGGQIGENAALGGFDDVTMRVYEMAHHIPFPLHNRVFATLIIAGKLSPAAFIVVQIPIDLSHSPAARYSSGKHRTDGESPRQKKRVVIGQYASVEKVEVAEDKRVRWIMATASDAKGWLPKWVQKRAVPGAIAKDVPWFLTWNHKQRKVQYGHEYGS
ncbi:hypothetical protein EJ06DRAFT_578671 [Trichodelitschia bisporula]|uniref:DUF3074 domain-containing protein n=1 Tax=Trichodelitschia bisporula TaxID=703511 RepID=A0A6G1IB42_9PEZI|nr:hypothetical protein EJ06DRAFT_578671 [Trichodelitschia bisporula]